jgi:hypothetical protein
MPLLGEQVEPELRVVDKDGNPLKWTDQERLKVPPGVPDQVHIHVKHEGEEWFQTYFYNPERLPFEIESPYRVGKEAEFSITPEQLDHFGWRSVPEKIKTTIEPDTVITFTILRPGETIPSSPWPWVIGGLVGAGILTAIGIAVFTSD